MTVERIVVSNLRGPTGDGGPIGPAGTVEGASTFVVSTTQPATPETGASQAMLKATTPTNPAGQPAPADVQVSFTHNPYAANAQGWTHPAYTNKTVAITVGYTTTYGKQISTEAGAAMIIEHGFIVQSSVDASNVKGVEFHWQMTGSDYAGYRPITAFAPWETADVANDSSLSMQGAFLDMKDGGGNSIISWNFRGSLSDAKVVSLNAKTQFQHAGNNIAWLKQFNAAGNAQLNLPYINAQNHLEEAQPTYGTLNTWDTNALGIYSAWSRLCGSVPNNARMHYLSAGGGSLATCTAYEAEITASTVAISVLRNAHASGDARQKIETIGTGNPTLQFSRTYVEANITWNGTTIAFDKPPKLPSFTLAGLPSASTAGAGSMAWCSNLSGGAGPVMSNGTDWKVIALGATAS